MLIVIEPVKKNSACKETTAPSAYSQNPDIWPYVQQPKPFLSIRYYFL